MEKAEQAVESAEGLMTGNDFNGAANRAYYAMYHAARAGLLSAGESGIGKHGTIIGRFSLVLVKNGPLSPELGRAINNAQRIRACSDYEPLSPDPDDVRAMVADAREFVAAVRGIIPPDQLGP